MFKFLVDTCVWLDLARDSKQASIVDVVEILTRRGDLELIVDSPRACVVAQETCAARKLATPIDPTPPPRHQCPEIGGIGSCPRVSQLAESSVNAASGVNRP